MEHLPNYERQIRPWGNFERYTLNEPSTVKVLTVDAGQATSLQVHSNRDEFWKILAGSGMVTVGDKRLEAHIHDTFECPRGTQHQIEGGPEGIQFLEIAFGAFDENDIARLSDRYGRV